MVVWLALQVCSSLLRGGLCGWVPWARATAPLRTQSALAEPPEAPTAAVPWPPGPGL